MQDYSDIFYRLRPNQNRLKSFGFTETPAGYEWQGVLPKTRLKIQVCITKDGQTSAQLQDPVSGGVYILHRLPTASGKFVGLVRQEYEKILSEIASACFEKDVFKSRQAKQIISYAREKYGDELEFLWKQFPDDAVLRRKDTAKWYAALLVISPAKLGLSGTEPIDILDVRVPPEKTETLVDGKHFFPGYHMNKKTWLTLLLDGSIPDGEIFSYLDASYQLAVK